MKSFEAQINQNIFIKKSLDYHNKLLLTLMAPAVAESRTAADENNCVLSGYGNIGLIRLVSIWQKLCTDSGIIFITDDHISIIANVLAQIYAHICLNPFYDSSGLALCMELIQMMNSFMLGEWFE